MWSVYRSQTIKLIVGSLAEPSAVPHYIECCNCDAANDSSLKTVQRGSCALQVPCRYYRSLKRFPHDSHKADIMGNYVCFIVLTAIAAKVEQLLQS